MNNTIQTTSSHIFSTDFWIIQTLTLVLKRQHWEVFLGSRYRLNPKTSACLYPKSVWRKWQHYGTIRFSLLWVKKLTQLKQLLPSLGELCCVHQPSYYMTKDYRQSDYTLWWFDLRKWITKCFRKIFP